MPCVSGHTIPRSDSARDSWRQSASGLQSRPVSTTANAASPRCSPPMPRPGRDARSYLSSPRSSSWVSTSEIRLSASGSRKEVADARLDRGARGLGAITGRPDLMNEHSVWVSLLSGVPMSRHGFYYYRRPVGNVRIGDDHGPGRERAALLGARGWKAVAVVDAPHFYPDTHADGIHLSGGPRTIPRFRHPPSRRNCWTA